ncbi:hypothetical protein INS49_004467 [Diaporthe citri]|uniref:uncharacterized protein n=1 Tax=Diaporthe citri TaxID=83186 RepID=UPI001C806385|nr:uncharacterized protein INS49_004467 [Diaporthe citri]KAG6354450.1 hypothetical protein INS49_004467 [Diaporthe citri]
MANIKLYAALVIVIERLPQKVQALILVILIVVTIYQISRPQVDLDTDHELPSAPSEDHRSLEPAATTPAFTRPPLRRRNCFVLGPNGITSEPLSSDWEFDSTYTSDAEGYETAPEDEAPARTMAEKRALAYFEDRLRQHRESVSSETSASPAVQTSLTDAQIREDHSDVEDAEMIKRRNVKMREEGVRVNVSYSQLTSLKPAPAPRPAPAAFSITAITEGLRGGASGPTSPPSSCFSPPSSYVSTTPCLSGLQSPAPTPITGTTTPELPTGPASVPPTSGQAGDETLCRIDEKMLAVPADAVSRRLLRDGRGILHRRNRLPRSASDAEGAVQRTPSPVEAGLQTSKSDEMWYPSEMNE